MCTPYFGEGYSHLVDPTIIKKQTPCLTADTSLPSTVSHSYISTPGGSVGGLGIVCGSTAPTTAHDSAIDVAFDNSAWQAQFDEQIRQFQQLYEQSHYQSIENAEQFHTVDAPYTCVSAHLVGSTGAGYNIEQRNYDSLCATIGDKNSDSAIGYGPCLPDQQDLQTLPGFVTAADHNAGAEHYVQTDHASHKLTLQYPTTHFSHHQNSISYQEAIQGLPDMYSTPYLQPAADIQEAYSRRLSVSSNAPSSIFSSECQSTPYFMTPSTTPRWASSISTEFPCTPISTLSSPMYPSHSRSLSSTSLRTPGPAYRPIRPAPYTLDAAQRQRSSTGKTMSLPSRRMQPPEFSFSPGHMRSVSEQIPNGMYFNDDFAHGDRGLFNQNLEVIRNSLQPITPSPGKSDDHSPTFKTEDSSPSSQRPVLAVIQPKIPPPLSILSVPRVPPLDLPEQPSRPTSPPSEELSPAEGIAPTQNPVSPYDAYTPKYKRGTKGQLEGFCGLCKPGRWLNMKNSRYWYDKNYNHGINSKTRRAFDLPVERRFKMGHSVIREGLCGTCHQWIDMDSCRMNWKHWWKHAYKVSDTTLLFLILLTPPCSATTRPTTSTLTWRSMMSPKISARISQRDLVHRKILRVSKCNVPTMRNCTGCTQPNMLLTAPRL